MENKTENYVHLIIRAYPFEAPLSSYDECSHHWELLKAAFPEALACTLMPNHAHLVTKTTDPKAAQLRFERCFRSPRCSNRAMWEPVPPPSIIADFKHLKRTIRYIHLNPCRDGLTTDPLTWEWSTHRDVLGLCEPQWVTPARMAEALRMASKSFAADFHGYVSGDPSVTPAGTPLPTSIRQLTWVRPEAGIAAINAVLRANPNAHLKRGTRSRRLAAHLLNSWAPTRKTLIAGLIGVGRQRVHELLAEPLSSSDQRALRACGPMLGDGRLRKTLVAARTTKRRVPEVCLGG